MEGIGAFFSTLNESLGYFDIFILSLFSSIIIFIPIPYIPILVAASFNNNLDPNIIAVISALGITFGRTLIFILSYYGTRILNNRIKKNTLPLKRLIKKYGWIVSFLAAITPFPPDDIVIILLGISKFSIWKFIITNFGGKLIANLSIIWGMELLSKQFIESMLLENQDPLTVLIVSLISLIIAALTIYAIVKLDWGKVIGRWFPWTLQEENEKD